MVSLLDCPPPTLEFGLLRNAHEGCRDLLVSEPLQGRRESETGGHRLPGGEGVPTGKVDKKSNDPFSTTSACPVQGNAT